MLINNIKFMPKFTPKVPEEEPRYRIEHLENFIGHSGAPTNWHYKRFDYEKEI